MNLKVLLDVAMPVTSDNGRPNLMGIVHGINWIIAFVIIAFVIAIVSIIIIRKGVKKYKAEEELEALRKEEAEESV